MTGPIAHRLAALRMAALDGHVDAGLATWAADLIAELAPAAERLEARDALIREAAALLDCVPWARARRIEQFIAGEAPLPVEAVELLEAARGFAPLPRGARQIYRVIAD